MSPGTSASLPTAIDPIFGLHYDVAAVKFEPLPVELYHACSDLTNDRWNRRAWMFARASAPDGQYIVIGGYYLQRGSAHAQTDFIGAIIRFQNGHCDAIGPAREEFDYPNVDIKADQLKALARDAVCRYARAFGTQHNFIEELRRQHIRLNNVQSPILKQALSAPAKVCQ